MSVRFLYFALLTLTFSAHLAPIASAQSEEEAQPEQTAKAAESKVVKPEDYAKVIKDLKRYEGAFTLLVRKNEVLLELKTSDIGKQFLLQATFNSGGNAMGMQAGDPIGAETINVFQFERHDDSLWLVVPNTQFRWNAEDPLALASDRSFPKAILSSFPIEQSVPDKGIILVNITSLFHGQVLQISDIVNEGGGTYSLDTPKCLVAKVKSFPENSVVRMQLHFYSANPPAPNPILQILGLSSPSQLEDARSLPLGVTYNLSWRKDTGYRPRLFDDRVGYFTLDFFNVARFLSPERTERYINRFQLKKKEPNAALSEPVKPIVWVIDPSVPKAYRKAIHDGILMWNPAMEAIGYKNAIQVIEDVKDPDYDHADARYNVIRWTISPDINGAYAIALFRTDPFTGEVLNAAVSLDANYLAVAFQDHRVHIEPELNTRTKDAEITAKLRKHGWTRLDCTYAEGLADSARFAWNTATATGQKISREEFAYQLLKETICHEVGHCLGLRHNFSGSTYLTVDELKNSNVIAQKGDTASVMDYTPTNILSSLKGNGFFFTPRVGIYDYWAIRYGYTELKATSPTDEKYALSQIANQSGKPGLAYMTDENADAWDPYVRRYDYSSNPLDYIGTTLYATKLLRQYAVEKLPKPGESYNQRSTLILSSINEAYAQCLAASSFIGGLKSGRFHKGDLGERPTLVPIDPHLQRKALALICATCFSSKSFDLPAKVLETLSLDPDSMTGSSWNAPIRRYLVLRSSALLTSLLKADLLSRISENEIKLASKKSPFTLEEHLSTLFNALFSEVGQRKSISPMRRDLQRIGVNAMISTASTSLETSGNDARAIITDRLSDLRNRIQVELQKPEKLDPATKRHLKDMRDSILRFMNRVSTTK